ncbi:hypothetical protein GCM10009551_025730 [Nocardiopsis tropica]
MTPTPPSQAKRASGTGVDGHVHDRAGRPSTPHAAHADARPRTSGAGHAEAFTGWPHHENHHRFHTALAGPPASRAPGLSGRYARGAGRGCSRWSRRPRRSPRAAAGRGPCRPGSTTLPGAPARWCGHHLFGECEPPVQKGRQIHRDHPPVPPKVVTTRVTDLPTPTRARRRARWRTRCHPLIPVDSDHWEHAVPRGSVHGKT